MAPGQSRVPFHVGLHAVHRQNSGRQSSRASSDDFAHGQAALNFDGEALDEPSSLGHVLGTDVSNSKSDSALKVPNTNGASRPNLGSKTSSQIFKSAVRRTVNVQRATSFGGEWDARDQEPGIDVRRVDMPDLQTDVVVQCADYSRDTTAFDVLSNETFLEYLERPRPEWSKIRWIHVNGLSWDVIKALAIKYDLHPLSIEDVLVNTGKNTSRSKADYYKQHLFLTVVVHKGMSGTGDEEPDDGDHYLEKRLGFYHRQASQDAETGASTTSLPAADPQINYRRTLMKAFTTVRGKRKSRNKDDNTGFGRAPLGLTLDNESDDSLDSAGLERQAAKMTVQALTKDVKVHIHVEQLNVFMLRDGTVISLFQDPVYHHKVSTIFDRIRMADGLLRTSQDPSLLVQALLDVVGDHALEIVDAFREQLTLIEGRVLARPDMDTVRHLHILSAQLLLLKSTLTPLHSLIQGLRFNDQAKAASALGSRYEIDGEQKPSGYMSHEGRVYLADVMDHVESVLSSLDLFSSLAENLVGYAFNTLGFSTNSFMAALSVISIIFLPLTFLSGYFGMNFASFPRVLDGDVAYFWYIAAPVATGTTIIFCFSYIVDFIQTARRQALNMYHKRLLRARRR